jgi:hypothetical protein
VNLPTKVKVTGDVNGCVSHKIVRLIAPSKITGGVVQTIVLVDMIVAGIRGRP